MRTIVSNNVTKGDAAEKLGLQTYDCAIPQKWLEDLVNVHVERRSPVALGLYEKAVSSLVWCYDGGSIMGYPYPLTRQGWDILNSYDIMKGTHYADPSYTVLEIQDATY